MYKHTKLCAHTRLRIGFHLLRLNHEIAENLNQWSIGDVGCLLGNG